MGRIFFGAGDIFDIAIQIEQNGAKFYREAASQIGDADVKRELLDLASMEDDHKSAFTQLQQNLVGTEEEADWFDAEDEAVQYLQAFAHGQIFDLTKDSGQVAGPDTSLNQILEWAIERERDSIVFYLGIKELVPPGMDGDKIGTIIKEEMSHVAQLSQRLMELAH